MRILGFIVLLSLTKSVGHIFLDYVFIIGIKLTEIILKYEEKTYS